MISGNVVYICHIMKNNILKGYFFAAASAISFGLIPLFIIPLNEKGIHLDTTLFFRFLFAALMIGVYCTFKKQSLRVNQRDLFLLFVLGILYALSAEFLLWGYSAMSPGIASTVLYVYPLMVAILLYWKYSEKISNPTRWSMFLALLGVLIIGWEGENMRFNFWGTIIVLTSAMTYALYMVIVNKGKLQAQGIVVTFYSVLFSSFYYLIKMSMGSFILPSLDTLGFISLFSLVTVVISVLFIILAIQWIGSTPTAILGALEPVVAVGVSVAIFGEKATWNLFAGLILVLSALMVKVLGDTQSLRH
ncbi:protein of unknown function DUF6 transmembrane [Leadbetterella byssophila DSM 17132]|uniref:EamA domain-containing protein n=2 Tax=Leadbetterella TaxID=319458 RepID=E4RXV3_LEAB4|nr:protein of unknown function DUF6 transmembrane [Leadbetterella byssophila DSM 17132]